MLYTTKDVLHHLAAAAIAGLSISIAHDGTNREYTHGWMEALMSEAASFGVSWSQVKAVALECVQDNDLLQLVERTM